MNSLVPTPGHHAPVPLSSLRSSAVLRGCSGFGGSLLPFQPPSQLSSFITSTPAWRGQKLITAPSQGSSFMVELLQQISVATAQVLGCFPLSQYTKPSLCPQDAPLCSSDVHW